MGGIAGIAGISIVHREDNGRYSVSYPQYVVSNAIDPQSGCVTEIDLWNDHDTKINIVNPTEIGSTRWLVFLWVHGE